MFEIVLPPRQRARHAVRGLFSMRRARVFTGWQLLRAAAIAAVAGAVAALLAAWWLMHQYPAPVEIISPTIEHAGERLEIVRFGFVYRGVASSCRMVLFKGRDAWHLECF